MMLTRVLAKSRGPVSAVVTPPAPGTAVTLTSIAADWADKLADLPGVNVHSPGGGSYAAYAYSSTAAGTPINRMLGNLASLGIRHIRDNAVTAATNATERTRQHDFYTALKALTGSAAIDVAWVGGDYKGFQPTAAQLSTEFTSQNHAGLVTAIEPTNEADLGLKWNGTATTSSTWSSTINTLADNVWNSFHTSITVLSPSMGSGSGGSYAGKGSASAGLGSQTSHAHINNLHGYPGGNDPATSIDTYAGTAHVSKSQATGATFPGGGTPIWFTETGYQNGEKSADGNAYAPTNVTGIYGPREMLEMYTAVPQTTTTGIKRAYLYQLYDYQDTAGSNAQANFGLYEWGRTTTPTFAAKPIATAIKNLIALFNDRGTVYTPSPLGLNITGGGTDLKYRLFGKRDGSYLLAIWRRASLWTPSTSVVGGGVAKTVTNVNCTVTTVASKTINRYNPSTAATIQQTAVGNTTQSQITFALGAELVVLKIA